MGHSGFELNTGKVNIGIITCGQDVLWNDSLVTLRSTYQYIAVLQFEDGVDIGIVAYQSVAYGVVHDGVCIVCYFDS